MSLVLSRLEEVIEDAVPGSPTPMRRVQICSKKESGCSQKHVHHTIGRVRRPVSREWIRVAKRFSPVTRQALFDSLDRYEKDALGLRGMIHGDAVFTNILLVANDKLKFIDMRGCVGMTVSGWGCVMKNNNTIIIPVTSNVNGVQRCTMCVGVDWITC